MNDISKVWVIIPAFDEARVIAKTLKDVQAYFRNIVVVDDCSFDETGKLALHAGAHVCRHSVNLGQGAALYTGIQYALLHQAEIIVTFDADGQHSARDAAAMVAVLESKHCDVVLGSRFLGKTEGLSRGKRLLLKVATGFTRARTSLAITDTHNGLRVLNRRAAEQIKIRQNRMAHASEILDQIAKLGLSYVEAPCTVTYSDYSLAKGQRMVGALTILADLFMRRIYK
jgi:glycosyltransferase involved in cell wall biosynthesis